MNRYLDSILADLPARLARWRREDLQTAAKVGTEVLAGEEGEMKLVDSSQGWMSDHEIATMVGFATLLAVDVPGDVLEIGAYKGRTTSGLVRAGDVVVVDTFMGGGELPEEDVFPAFEKNLIEIGVKDAGEYESHRVYWSDFGSNLLVLRGDSREILPKMSALLPTTYGSKFRLILVDGSHATDVAGADMRNAWALLSPGGYLFMDDLDWTSVREASWQSFAAFFSRTQYVTKKLGYLVKP